MKKCLSAILLLALSVGLQAADVKVNIRKMTAEGAAGNQQFPVVAENDLGQRLYVYRGGDAYVHSYFYRNGTWVGGARVPGSPQFEDYWFSDIVADSTGTFHFVAEDADRAMYYAYFQNGAWAAMRKIDFRHEATLALGVLSNDTVVLVSAIKTISPKGVTKDVILGTKPKGAKEFSGFKNITQDFESSTMVDVAIDSKDKVWIAYKGAFLKGGGETLQAVLLGLDKSYKQDYFKNVSGQEGAWCWYPSVAVNSEGKIMVTWMMSQEQLYFYRLYDTKTDKWTEIKALINGPIRPWPTMYNHLLARGADFYWVGLSGDRYVRLYKYDAGDHSWSKIADASNAGANWCSASNGDDSILISWDNNEKPSSCFLTTVSVAPTGPVTKRIAGTVEEGSEGLSGVTMSGLPGNPVTDSFGDYRADVESGWTGTVVPKKTNYTFNPTHIDYDKPVTSAKINQDYTATMQFKLTISAAAGGTTNPAPALYFHDPNSHVTVRALPSANYKFTNWTGDVPDPPNTANPITVTVDKDRAIRANFFRPKSVVNLSAEKRVERSFFRGYSLNVLTWAANPENAAHGITVANHRVYRKAQEEDSTKWVRIAELAGTALRYEDRNVPQNSALIYAVTCVDDLGNESSIY